MNPKIANNQIWQYVGPANGTAVQGQLHKVMQAFPSEIISVGLPYGQGGAFLGTALDFHKNFRFMERVDE